MSASTPATEFPLPPANFSFLVESILMQAQLQLGLLHLGEKDEEEEAEPNLPLARHTIDTLSMLQEKTKGNLTLEEQRMLENGLTELRFRYVEISDRLKRKGQPAQETEKDSKEENHPLIVTSDGGKGTKSA